MEDKEKYFCIAYMIVKFLKIPEENLEDFIEGAKKGIQEYQLDKEAEQPTQEEIENMEFPVDKT